jgi:hypothetical protein
MEDTAEQYDTRAKVGGPDALTLTVCASCSRTDRWQPLKARHFADGGLCPGPVEQVVFVRVDLEGA